MEKQQTNTKPSNYRKNGAAIPTAFKDDGWQMNKTCKQCKETKSIFMFARTTDSYGKIKYLSFCKACKSLAARNRRKADKIIQVVLEPNPLEQSKTAFKDDPKAEKENDYGKVVRVPTYVRGDYND